MDDEQQEVAFGFPSHETDEDRHARAQENLLAKADARHLAAGDAGTPTPKYEEPAELKQQRAEVQQKRRAAQTENAKGRGPQEESQPAKAPDDPWAAIGATVLKSEPKPAERLPDAAVPAAQKSETSIAQPDNVLTQKVTELSAKIDRALQSLTAIEAAIKTLAESSAKQQSQFAYGLFS